MRYPVQYDIWYGMIPCMWCNMWYHVVCSMLYMVRYDMWHLVSGTDYMSYHMIFGMTSYGTRYHVVSCGMWYEPGQPRTFVSSFQVATHILILSLFFPVCFLSWAENLTCATLWSSRGIVYSFLPLQFILFSIHFLPNRRKNRSS